jgi:hypothetical protein
MRVVFLSIVLGLFALLTGCETLTDYDCQQAAAKGWGPIGERDGARGRGPSALVDSHTERCATIGVTLDRSSYASGWALGNARYCSPANAGSLGRSGSEFKHEVCLGSALEAIESYRSGLRTKASELESALSRARISSGRANWSQPKSKEADAYRRQDQERAQLESELSRVKGYLARLR